MSVYQGVYVPCVGNVRALYSCLGFQLLWLLMPFLVTPQPSNGALIGSQWPAGLAL